MRFITIFLLGVFGVIQGIRVAQTDMLRSYEQARHATNVADTTGRVWLTGDAQAVDSFEFQWADKVIRAQSARASRSATTEAA